MSAMAWTAVPHYTSQHDGRRTERQDEHPDVARSHRPRRDSATAPSIRRVPGTGTPPPPVCDLVDVAPARRRTVHQWVERYARTVLEVIAGERPAAQISRWTNLTVHHDLSRRAHLVARATRRSPSPTATAPATTLTAAPAGTPTAAHPTTVPRATVRSVHVSFLDDHTIEASVHVRQGERSRAFAARFEWRRDRWVCTALDFC